MQYTIKTICKVRQLSLKFKCRYSIHLHTDHRCSGKYMAYTAGFFQEDMYTFYSSNKVIMCPLVMTSIPLAYTFWFLYDYNINTNSVKHQIFDLNFILTSFRVVFLTLYHIKTLHLHLSLTNVPSIIEVSLYKYTWDS